MAIFVITRRDPGEAPETLEYANLELADRVRAVGHSDGKFYTLAWYDDGYYYFGPEAGYATEAEAKTALDTLLGVT